MQTRARTESLAARAELEIGGAAAERFANLALACVHREYPNKVSHSLNGDGDVAPPRKLTPAFYGCYDWHSSVHNHWLLVRLAKIFPDAPFLTRVREALRKNLTEENLAQEAAYLSADGRASFERPYGLAWLLQLAAELHEWNDPEARQFTQNLVPLERAALQRLQSWLPNLTHPVRTGEHAQTAFALAVMLDYARSKGDAPLVELVIRKALDFYVKDKNGPLEYEPSGEDFLSPCLGEADLMRRVLPNMQFAQWLQAFLPQISSSRRKIRWLHPVVSPDPADPKFSHLDGLNLSRAWMLEGIAGSLPSSDRRLNSILSVAEEHRLRGFDAVTGKHYEGGHWLGSFAVYLLTRRGIAVP